MVSLCSFIPNHHSACENEAVSISALLIYFPSKAGTVEVDGGSLIFFLLTIESMMGSPVYFSPSPVAEMLDWLKDLTW